MTNGNVSSVYTFGVEKGNGHDPVVVHGYQASLRQGPGSGNHLSLFTTSIGVWQYAAPSGGWCNKLRRSRKAEAKSSTANRPVSPGDKRNLRKSSDINNRITPGQMEDGIIYYGAFLGNKLDRRG